MKKKQIIIFILVILIILIGVFFCLFKLSMQRSDDTIARIDRKIEMYEGSRR